MAATAFISHSSRDRGVVEREIVATLRRHGIKPWYSREDIQTAEQWERKILQGLQQAEWFVLVMSEHSAASEWVKAEVDWAVNNRWTPGRIVPVLIRDCKPEGFHVWIPRLQHADFREDAEAGRRQLLACFGVAKGALQSHSQLERVERLLRELEEVRVIIPCQPPINVVATLRALPRQGKFLRLNKNKLKLECRSVLDHVRSMAHTADQFLPHLSHGLSSAEIGHLASCITFHDLCEVLVDDYPVYTDTSRLLGYERTPAELEELERAANTLIRPWLGEKLLTDFDESLAILEDKQSLLTRFVTILDKIDPIIAIWRYLHQFRGKFDSASKFIAAMDHFFSNANVRRACEKSAIDPDRICGMVEFMQAADNAKRYYRDSSVLDEMAAFASIEPAMPRKLVEGIRMEFARPSAGVK